MQFYETMRSNENDTEFFRDMSILNDAMRKTAMAVYFSPSNAVNRLPKKKFFALLEAIKKYDDFTPDNDPLGGHTHGKIKLFGKTFVWIFEYVYPKNEPMEFGDPRVVRRIAVMLAEEFAN